jgi:DNA-binding transcriptional ArsR family regulator
MEVIRSILLAKESSDRPVVKVEGIDKQKFSYHVKLLLDAGYIEGSIAEDSNWLPVDAVVKDVTWSGHEFIEVMKDDTVWEKVKTSIIDTGKSWSMDILFELLKDAARNQFSF